MHCIADIFVGLNWKASVAISVCPRIPIAVHVSYNWAFAGCVKQTPRSSTACASCTWHMLRKERQRPSKPKIHGHKMMQRTIFSSAWLPNQAQLGWKLKVLEWLWIVFCLHPDSESRQLKNLSFFKQKCFGVRIKWFKSSQFSGSNWLEGSRGIGSYRILSQFRIWFKTTASNEVMRVVSRNAWRAPAFKFIEGLGICSAESWGQLWNCVKSSNIFYQKVVTLDQSWPNQLEDSHSLTRITPRSLGWSELSKNFGDKLLDLLGSYCHLYSQKPLPVLGWETLYW